MHTYERRVAADGAVSDLVQRGDVRDAGAALQLQTRGRRRSRRSRVKHVFAQLESSGKKGYELRL